MKTNIWNPHHLKDTVSEFFQKTTLDSHYEKWFVTSVSKWIHQTKNSIIPVTTYLNTHPNWVEQALFKQETVEEFYLGHSLETTLNSLCYLLFFLKITDPYFEDSPYKTLQKTPISYLKNISSIFYRNKKTQKIMIEKKSNLQEDQKNYAFKTNSSSIMWETVSFENLKTTGILFDNCLKDGKYEDYIKKNILEIVCFYKNNHPAFLLTKDPNSNRLLGTKTYKNKLCWGYQYDLLEYSQKTKTTFHGKDFTFIGLL